MQVRSRARWTRRRPSGGERGSERALRRRTFRQNQPGPGRVRANHKQQGEQVDGRRALAGSFGRRVLALRLRRWGELLRLGLRLVGDDERGVHPADHSAASRGAIPACSTPLRSWAGSRAAAVGRRSSHASDVASAQTISPESAALSRRTSPGVAMASCLGGGRARGKPNLRRVRTEDRDSTACSRKYAEPQLRLTRNAGVWATCCALPGRA